MSTTPMAVLSLLLTASDVLAVPFDHTAVALTPTRLRVNYLDAPLAIDDTAPTFSWELQAPEGERAVVGSCSLSVKAMDALGAVVSEGASGPSSATTFVPLPAGVTLTTDTEYSWTVTCGTKSASSTFSTGLLKASDWGAATFISGTDSEAVLMRKTFSVAGTVKRARVFVAVPGYGQVSLNGKDVDGIAGTRTWSQYDLRTLYHTYDVTEHLVSGSNVLGLHVGKGWYGMWGYGNPTAKAVLRITTTDGNTVTIATDASWKAGASPISMDSEYNGETYDARNETAGWDTTACTACGKFTAVTTGAKAASKLTKTTLSSASFAAIDVMHRFTAKWMREPKPGTYVFDFTQNIAGWVKLRITGTAGTTVTLRHAEALMHPPYGPRDGNIYVGNLRSAKATDVYILKGDLEGEEFQPVFTQHGFRYVEMTITGTDDPTPPTLDMLEAVNIRSGMEQSGTAAFSDLMLNQVQHNILWGQADNLMMIPTDCDNRDERLGWTGDSALSSVEASLNYDMGAFYDNWARMLDDTSPNGAIGCTVPGHAGGGNLSAGGSCDASWTSVYPSVVWATMKYQGDLEIVKANWPGLTRFMDNELHRVSSSTKGIKNIFANFGDWVPAPDGVGHMVPGGAEGRIDIHMSAGFSFVGDLRNMADMANKTGNAADAAKYGAAYTKYKAAWHAAWYDTTTGVYGKGEQTSHVLALYIDAPPPNLKAKALDTLVKNILAHNNHTTCGIIGWRFELDVLSANGYGELAYALITQQTYPSFGFEILDADEPATTVWELWDGPYEGPGMNSRNHIMFGAPGDWVYLYAAGLTQTADSIGFSHAVFAPPSDLIKAAARGDNFSTVPNATISPPLRWGSASKQTMRGTVSVEWNLPVPSGGGTSKPVTCGMAKENQMITLGCPSGEIKTVSFGEYGTPSGDCSKGWTKGKCGADLAGNLSAACVGKPSCTLECQGPACKINGKSLTTGDPCYQTVKKVAAQVTCAAAPGPPPSKSAVTLTVKTSVPAGSIGTTLIPLVGAAVAAITVTEGSGATVQPVWKAGKYVPGVLGVTGASVSAAGIAIEHGSGSYAFVRSG